MTAVETTELGVWLLGERAGTLGLQDGRLRFRYEARWLQEPGATPLSQSLPLLSEPFDDQACRPFFAGLLPEGELRRRIAMQCQISYSNDFGLLAAIGGDCAGAVSLELGDPAAVERSVINEAFCMALAKVMGLQVADTEILLAGDQQILLVRRYDRCKYANDQWLRLHQEDFCQALGVPPELKYQNEGGPDLQACFALLRRATKPSAPEVIRLLDAVVFNALIGNHDAHAKNFSLLYGSRGATIAPLYDLLCTAAYSTLTTKMAMKLGSKYSFAEVQVRHWELFAVAAGLSQAQTRKRVVRMAEQLPLSARGLQTESSYRDHALIERIACLIEQRCALTLRRINAG